MQRASVEYYFVVVVVVVSTKDAAPSSHFDGPNFGIRQNQIRTFDDWAHPDNKDGDCNPDMRVG